VQNRQREEKGIQPGSRWVLQNLFLFNPPLNALKELIQVRKINLNSDF